MIEAKISRENEKQVIHAEGNVLELANDVAVLISGIYNQFLHVDAGTAEMFRVGLQAIVKDRSGPCWKANDGQVGVIFPKKEEE